MPWYKILGKRVKKGHERAVYIKADDILQAMEICDHIPELVADQRFPFSRKGFHRRIRSRHEYFEIRELSDEEAEMLGLNSFGESMQYYIEHSLFEQ